MSDSPPASPLNRPLEDLQDLYENAPCGYLSIQPDGRLVKANATFCKWIGFSMEELLAMRLHDLLNVAGRVFFETHFAPLLRMQGFFNEVALDFVTRDGARLPSLVNAAERRDGAGTHLYTRLAVFIASDRRRYERELLEARTAAEHARQELERLNASIDAALRSEQETAQLREEFIAVLGHDLRNPLSAVISGATVILRSQPGDRIARVAKMIESSGKRMAGLIDNVLDFTRGRLGGGVTLNRNADAPLEPVLWQVIDELQASWPQRPIEALFAFDDPLDCDRTRVAQLFSNLLANAITHGDANQPIRAGAASDGGSFELWVANGGIPIPPAVLERLFYPFYRGGVMASQQGLGLGLYICAAIARAHDGALHVSSTVEETRFTFRMPVRETR